MKKLLLITLMIVCSAWAYSQKIVSMPEATTTTGTDIIIIEDAIATKHMTITNLFGTIPVALATTGTITGSTMLTLDTDASVVLAVGDCDNAVRYNNDADAIDYTLPGAAAGLTIMFYDIGGGVITIDPVDGTDTIYLNGTSVGAGDAIDSPGDVGDFICLMAIDDTRWVTVGRSGVWVDGGAD